MMPFWQDACWIGVDWGFDARPVSRHPHLFRRTFDLTEVPPTATLRITASPMYTLWINGNLICSGPARSYPERQVYDELNVSDRLNTGANSLEVLLFPPTGAIGYGCFTRFGLLAGLWLDDAKTPALVTDARWQVRPANHIDTHGLLLSTPTQWQEHCDCLSSAQSKPSAWVPAFALGPAESTPPWKTLEPRPIPMLKEEQVPLHLCWQGNTSRETICPSENLARRFNKTEVAGQAMGSGAAEWQNSDDHNLAVFDFGMTRLFRPGIETSATRGPVQIEVYYSNELTDRPRADLGFGKSHEGFCDSFRPADGNGLWQSCGQRGFRFLIVKIAGHGQCRFRPACRLFTYPFAQNVAFSCSAPLIQDLWKTSINNLLASTNDVIVDTCSRENVLWTIDACVSAKAAAYTFGETAMWRRCMDLIAQGIDEQGMPCTVVPSDGLFMRLYDQAMHWVISSRDYYYFTADDDFLRHITNPIHRFLHACARAISEENYFVPPSHSWHWIDWAPVCKESYALPVNALLLLAVQAAGDLAKRSGDATLAATVADIERRLRPALDAFYDERMGAFGARIEPRVPLPAPSVMGSSIDGWRETFPYGLHANALAVQAGVGTEEQRRSALDRTADVLRQAPGNENYFGIGWTDMLLAPFFNQHSDAAMTCLNNRFGPMIQAHYPTWGEAFTSPPHNTAHGWGASVNALLIQSVLGLKHAEPGWQEVTLSPAAGLDFDFDYRLQLGKKCIHARRESGRCHVEAV